MAKNVQLLVCLHKDYKIPLGNIYLPIHVGKALIDTDLGITGDDTGDNISTKNPSFCELTAHYWAWKNLPEEVEYIGLAHYRRYLMLPGKKRGIEPILPDQIERLECITPNEVISALTGCDIILPHPVTLPHSLKTDYCIAHIREDLAITGAVIRKLYPEYLPAFDHVMACNNRFSPCNMFIARRDLFDGYSKWLFDVLFEAERHIRISPYPQQARVFGYLAERLLNVYCYHHRLKIRFTSMGFLCEESAREVKTPSRYSTLRKNLTFWAHRGMLRRHRSRVNLDKILQINKIEIK